MNVIIPHTTIKQSMNLSVTHNNWVLIAVE